jgi:Cdc6-like AAA superfamily ATPase
VLRQIERFLRNPHQHAITIYGQRRVGKTSILQYLETNLPQQGSYIPILFDLMPLADGQPDRVLQELACKIAYHLQLPEPNLTSPLTESFRTTFLPALRQHLPEQAKLVLLFDEFDILADPQDRNKDRGQILGYLHELFQLQSEQPWMKFVLTLGRNIEDLDIIVHGLLNPSFVQGKSLGKSLRNRDHEAHCSINFCSSLERRPRCLGGCQRGGGT